MMLADEFKEMQHRAERVEADNIPPSVCVQIYCC